MEGEKAGFVQVELVRMIAIASLRGEERGQQTGILLEINQIPYALEDLELIDTLIRELQHERSKME